jgi:hypothetical protein
MRDCKVCVWRSDRDVCDVVCFGVEFRVGGEKGVGSQGEMFLSSHRDRLGVLSSH